MNTFGCQPGDATSHFIPSRLLQALEDQLGRLAGLCRLDDLEEAHETTCDTSCCITYCNVLYHKDHSMDIYTCAYVHIHIFSTRTRRSRRGTGQSGKLNHKPGSADWADSKPKGKLETVQDLFVSHRPLSPAVRATTSNSQHNTSTTPHDGPTDSSRLSKKSCTTSKFRKQCGKVG